MKSKEVAALEEGLAELSKQVAALAESVKELAMRQPMVHYYYSQPWITTAPVTPSYPTITYTIGGDTFGGTLTS